MGADVKLAQKVLAEATGRSAKRNVDQLAETLCKKHGKALIGRGPYCRVRFAIRVLKYVGRVDLAEKLSAAIHVKIQARTSHKIKKIDPYQKRKADRQAFYDSDAWKRLRYQALKMHGAICQCCGASRADGVQIHVDHIKPRSKYPHLELELSNLQILCEPCNIGKSAIDETDWRDQPKTRGTVIWN